MLDQDVVNDRKMLYIASPLRGDVDRNVENAMRYCARAIEEGYIPVAPHAMYRGIFDDEIPEQRAVALQVGLQLLDQCEKMWVCGDRVSEGMRGEIARAEQKGIQVELKPEAFFREREQKSAEQTRPHTFNALRTRVETAVAERCRDGTGVLELLKIKANYPAHSVSNAMAIRQQNPNAKMIATRHQWKELGYRITGFQRSIKVWKPIQQVCFKRDGKLIDANAATPAENSAMSKGTLPTTVHTVYKLDLMYDISQTDCPQKDYAKVMENPYAALSHENLYGCLCDVAEKCGISVNESDDAKLAHVGACLSGDEISVSSRVHIDKRVSSLAVALAKGIVEESSTQPEDVRVMESQCLAFLLQSRIGVPPTVQDITLPSAIATEATKIAGKPALDGNFGRVQRMLEFADSRLSESVAEHGLGLAPEQTAKKEHGLSRQQQDINKNFTMDLD